MKKVNLYLQSLFYVFAGVNHFINPEFYYPLIPDYLDDLSGFINIFSGVGEVFLGISLLIPKLRKRAAYGIVLMLIAFVPSHIYFIQTGSCIDNSLCVDEWIGWVRLVVIHPLLIRWAWSVRDFA
ncbi:MAG: hypothetical protein GDA51_01020 [Ekhidna sp.]|nr:hypothetical protein [Ekhidna sp.]MBC6410404.1 hypothetical protein [Ekhidna sp.]MBC6425063.1 hypothetical protein [Ekhidna sp.]